MYEQRPIYAYSICRWPRSKCVVSEHIIMWKHLYSDDWHWQQCYVSNRFYSMSNQLYSPFFYVKRNEIQSSKKGTHIQQNWLKQSAKPEFVPNVVIDICISNLPLVKCKCGKNKLRRIKFTCYLFKIQRMKRKKDDFIGCSFNFLLLPSFLNLISLHRESMASLFAQCHLLWWFFSLFSIICECVHFLCCLHCCTDGYVHERCFTNRNETKQNEIMRMRVE